MFRVTSSVDGIDKKWSGSAAAPSSPSLRRASRPFPNVSFSSSTFFCSRKRTCCSSSFFSFSCPSHLHHHHRCCCCCCRYRSGGRFSYLAGDAVSPSIPHRPLPTYPLLAASHRMVARPSFASRRSCVGIRHRPGSVDVNNVHAG